MADGVEFPCHRLVLACHSEYFSRMFEGSFAEAKVRQCVQLPGKTSETVSALLRVMYFTTTVDEVLREDPAGCLHLLELSREWLLQDVLDRCVRFIKEEISDAATLQLLMASMPHGDDLRELRDLCQEKLRTMREAEAAKAWNLGRNFPADASAGGRRPGSHGAGRWPVGRGTQTWSSPIHCPRGLGW